jgi:MoaA/NifB/PqqE/SkfB family radical SAM enzyme
MKQFRQDILHGKKLDFCSACHYEESFDKLNGRIRQLNKSAIDVNNFALTTRSSPHYKNFKYSFDNDGEADLAPVDLQINLSNLCNSACIMCGPEASSRLVADYKKLNLIDSSLFKKPSEYTSWTQNPETFKKFLDELVTIKNLRYIHFLGGETFYDPAFYKICDHVIENKIDGVIIGTTTNGTIINDKIKEYIAKFKEFHLGISIESVTELNDYIRWPGKVSEILPNIEQYLKLRESNPGLYISLRITPNILSIYDIDKLFVYLLENKVIAESCNILYDPAHLRIELLPEDIRDEIKNKIKAVIDYYELTDTNIVNIRRPDLINAVTSNTVLDYYTFISEYQTPQNLNELRHNLIIFLKSFESIRNNSIIDYLPRYEKFLRNYGY